MNEIFRKRIERRLESLPDDIAHQILDYIEFLESKYGSGAAAPSPFQQVAEKVEDVLRAGRLPAAAIKGTMNVMDTAARVMSGLADASRAAAAELGKSVPKEAAGTEEAAKAGEAAEGAGRPEGDKSESA